MAQWLTRCCVLVAKYFGFRLEREYRPVVAEAIPRGARLYVGCGEQQLEGYYGCDLRPLDSVALACKAWDVSTHCRELAEIYSRHMLEHLTFAEARLTLRDWYSALADDGLLRIEVPNLAFAIGQWQRATWSEEALQDRYSDARWGFAGFFGWQRECDPEENSYNTTYWDVHKSGYTSASMQFFLEEAGFQDIEIHFEGFTEKQNRRRNLAPIRSQGCHLIATAHKTSVAQRKIA
jgi:predicted SAM-dependent methyltransferase